MIDEHAYVITCLCHLMSHHETLMFDFAGSRPDDKKSEGALEILWMAGVSWRHFKC